MNGNRASLWVCVERWASGFAHMRVRRPYGCASGCVGLESGSDIYKLKECGGYDDVTELRVGGYAGVCIYEWVYEIAPL